MTVQNKSIVLAIPMYNCRNQITSVLRDLASVKPKIDCLWIIDNKSEDGSIDVVIDYLNLYPFPYNTLLLQNEKNIGFGGSHKVIFDRLLKSEFSSVVVLHGDYQARSVDLKNILQNRTPGDTAILGARFMPNSSRSGYSKLRVIWNWIFNLMMSIRYKQRIYDLGSGLNIFPRDIVASLNVLTLPSDLTFNVELLKRLLSQKTPIEWHPIEWVSEHQKSNVHIFSQTLKTLKLIIGDPREEKLVISEPRIRFEYKCNS